MKSKKKDLAKNLANKNDQKKQEESSNPTADIDFQTSEDLYSVCRMVHNRTVLSGLTILMWKSEHDDIIFQFLVDESKSLLIIYIDKNDCLQIEFAVPSFPVKEVCYFIKASIKERVTTANFQQVMQFGTLKANYVTSLFLQISKVYASHFLESKSLPQCIQEDLSNNLHEFLARMTDFHHRLHKKTVLYLPEDIQNITSEEAVKDKELIRRLEGILMHWVYQIKRVLMEQHAMELDDQCGPLEEVEFWKQCYTDLTNINQQLKLKEVEHIVTILIHAKSTCLHQFTKLNKEVQESLNESESNLKFLSILNEPCQKLENSTIDEIPSQIPNLLNLIRFIWTNSPCYNDNKKIVGMLRKVSNAVIHACCQEINLENLFSGYVTSSREILSKNISCCSTWKAIYEKISAVHKHYSPKYPWDLDKKGIFAPVDAYIQRCKDLIEICNTQIQFCRFTEGEQTPYYILSGHHGQNTIKQLVAVEEKFKAYLRDLKEVKDSVFNVRSTVWHENYTKYVSLLIFEYFK